jgi:phosphate transport system substrate-binding protein
VQDIFAGTVQNWKDVGGPNAPIHLDIRNPVSGTYLGFRELAMQDKPYAAKTNAFTSYEAIVQDVSQDPAAVGYCGLNLATNTGIKTLTIEGIAPSGAALKEGKYPYIRTLRFYTNKGNEPKLAADFISFVESAEGQKVVAQLGYAPKP